MEIEYDPDADAAYIYLDEHKKKIAAKTTKEISEGIIVDFDTQGRMIGVEILYAKKFLRKETLAHAKIIGEH